ncbi:MAG: hypothetical protein ACO1NQ_11660, partial [Flavobacteriales bacterium]
MRTYLLQLVVALFSVVTVGGTSVAQVFIADQGYRDALNAVVPGLVDGTGMMDTSHPGLAAVDSLVLTFEASSTSVELNGLEHFSQVQRLSIGPVYWPQGENGVIEVTQSPPNVMDIYVTGTGSITMNELPAMLGTLWVSESLVGGDLSLTLNYPPSEIGTLWLDAELDWSDMVNVGQLMLSNWMTNDIVLPPINATYCQVSGVMYNLDLSPISVEYLHFNGTSVWGEFILPEEVSKMYYDVETAIPLQSWPSSLDSLYIRGWNICDPPFPEDLRSLEYHLAPSCLPNWPPLLDSIVVLQPGYSSLFENTATYCSVLNSECPGAYPALAGVVRMDLNSNGTPDAD